MNWQPYDPLEHKAVINFKLGPQGFKIPEPRAQSEEFPSPSQLYIIFTDIRNLCASTVKDQISLVEEEGDEDLKILTQQFLRVSGIFYHHQLIYCLKMVSRWMTHLIIWLNPILFLLATRKLHKVLL